MHQEEDVNIILKISGEAVKEFENIHSNEL